MVLYPNDSSESGKELRLRQQYFLASASLQDVLARWVGTHGRDFADFAEQNVFQLNDTHPSCCVPELMRLLIDEHGLGWDAAWAIITRTMAYTNHTLLPEALEKWPVRLFRHLLPRLLEIIFEINARFLAEVAQRWPGDSERQRRMSLIEEGPEPMVRMAYLAIVGSFSVNGVAALHSRLLSEGLFRDFYELWPEKFNNKTNGVTPRRWLAWSNPPLCRPDLRYDRRRLDCRSAAAGAAGAVGRGCRFPRPLECRPTNEQGAAGGAGAKRMRRRFLIPMRCSMSRSSGSTNTSGSCSIFCTSSISTTGSSGATPPTGPTAASSSAARPPPATSWRRRSSS